MKYKYYLLILSLFLSLQSFAQVGKFIKEKKEQLDEKINSWMENIRNDFDTTSFNYAIGLNDNTGLFEDRERFDKYKDLVLIKIAQSDTAHASPLQDAREHNQAGEISFVGNKFYLAEERFQKAKEIYESNDLTQNLNYAKCLSNLGLLYHVIGRYQHAESLTEQALVLRAELVGSTHAAYGASLNNKALLYKDMGKYTDAEKLINQALDIISQDFGTHFSGYAICLNNKAILLQTMGRYQEAEELYLNALEVANEDLRKKSTTYQRMLVNLASLYQLMEEYEKAEEIYKKAIRTKKFQLKKKHPDYAYMLNNLAGLYLRMNKMEEIEELLLKAKEIYEETLGTEHPAYAATISNLGNFYRMQQQFSEAETLLLESFEIRKKLLGERHPKFVESQEDLAILYWKMDDIEQAKALYTEVIQKSDEFIKSFFPSMSSSEKEKYWSQTYPTYLRFFNFVIENPKLELLYQMYEQHLSTKAILLSTTNRLKTQILSSGDQTLINDYLQWLKMKEEIAQLYTLDKEQLEIREIDLDSLELAANNLEKKLSETSYLFNKNYNNEHVNTNFSDIQFTLSSGEAAVDIIELPKFEGNGEIMYVAFIITSDSDVPKIVKIENAQELNTKFYQLYRNMIHSKRSDTFSYQNYWQAIDEELSQINKVYVSLDGVYNQLNLSSLQKEDGTYLLDETSFVILTNMRDLLLERPISNSSEAILVGFPDYGSLGKLTPLPGTKKEVETISNTLSYYNVKTYTAAEATETQIKQVSRPKYLHIATHGFFIPDVKEGETRKVFGVNPEKAKENPMLRSGLMLANAENAIEGLNITEIDGADNGILSAYEVSNLDLEGSVVALSACETGLGDVKKGEGVYGLQRAFQVAGANAILMSLWKVSDEATTQLMSYFYSNLSMGVNRIDAFRQAQLSLKYEYPEPYYWAAFVMVGR